jgi:type IV secretory pathway VirB4 component
MTLNISGHTFDYIINKLNALGKEGWEYLFEKENKYVLKRKINEYSI